MDLTALQRAIQQTIQRQLTGVCTCEWYPVMRQALVAPAVLLELAEMYPAANPGTDELALDLRFEARVVMAYTRPDAVLATPALALELAGLIDTNTWACPVTPARVVQATPDGFKPELDAYCVWQVDWQQQGRLGSSVWTKGPIDPTPHTVMVGLEPTDILQTGPNRPTIGGKTR